MLSTILITAEILELILSFYGNVKASHEITCVIERFFTPDKASKLMNLLIDYARGDADADKILPLIEGVSPDVWHKISEEAIKLLEQAESKERSVWTRCLALARLKNEIGEDEFCAFARAFRELPLQTLMDAGINGRFDKMKGQMLANYGILKMRLERGEIRYVKFGSYYQLFNEIRQNVLAEMAKE